MVGYRSRAGIAALFFLVAFPAACSDSGAGVPVDETVISGTCDSSASAHHCLEVTSLVDVVEREQSFCSDPGETWLSDRVCPRGAGLVGCCEYEARGLYRECFYEGAVDPQEYCESSVHGDWH